MAAVGDVLVRKFDIIVFGATGYTGQYVVEELARTADEEKELTWAIAGRNIQKLQKTLTVASEQIGLDVDSFVL